VNSWYGVFVPSATPAPIVARLNKELVRALSLPDVRERLMRDGVEPGSSTPAQLLAVVQAEKKLWTKVIKDAGIKVQ
jgi:tripartite-type tricarboxylate transporter receptor subunit TctC